MGEGGERLPARSAKTSQGARKNQTTRLKINRLRDGGLIAREINRALENTAFSLPIAASASARTFCDRLDITTPSSTQQQ